MSKNSSNRGNKSLPIISITVVPVTIAFEIDLDFSKDGSTSAATLALLIDISLLLDMILTFRSSYKDDEIKTFVRNEKDIRHNYIQNNFIMDLITALPIELMIYGFAGESEPITALQKI